MRISGKLAHVVLVIGLCSLMTGPSLAQDLPNLREARQLTFADRGAVEVEVVPFDGISATDLAILNSDQLAGAINYYGAIAMAPGMGLASEATSATANFHDVENASRVALEQCNDARTSGPACVVVLLVRPDGWEPGRSLQLNTQATAALRGEYRRFGRPRVMAISDATGQWGIGEDADAAVAQCGQPDCRAVVMD